MCTNYPVRFLMRVSVSIVLGVVLLSATPALAVVVAPGDSNVALSGSPGLPGTVISDLLRPFAIQDSTGNVILTGNLQDRVVELTGTGYLSFEPRLRDIANPGAVSARITGLQLMGYGGFATDIDFATDGLGEVGPNAVSRSADGSELTFNYDTPAIVPPQEGEFLQIYPDASYFAPIGAAVILAQSGTASEVISITLQGINVPVREPIIPEPATCVIWSAMALVVAVYCRSRRREPA